MITLTGKEILDLATFAGLVDAKEREFEQDILDTQYTISGDHTGLRDAVSKNTIAKYRYKAHLTKYPEEGCYPLGYPQSVNSIN